MNLTRSAILEALAPWNSWGTGQLDPGVPRRIVSRLEPFLDTREVVALVGPRRAGKTTVLLQLMAALAQRGVEQKALLHVNFEEPALGPELGIELLEKLYRAFRSEIYPTGRAYLFLDEIQHVVGWERWVRARNESEDVKIFLTGSSARLMSRELGTLLTGRHVTFRVWPLDFREFLRFRGIEPPAEPRLAGTPAEMQHALLDYLRWGGFPEVVLAQDDERRHVLLRQYFDDILFKDIALRHEVRGLVALRNLAVHLLGQTASLVSLKRIAGVFEVSLDLARAYCAHLEEAFLVSWTPFFSLKTPERLRRPRKVHAVDTGLRNAVSLSGSPDRGRLAETAVHNALAQGRNDGVFYWQGDGEVDLLVRQGNEIERLVQVAWGGEDDAEVRRRELGALEEAQAAFPGARSVWVVGETAGFEGGEETSVVPLWRFLLEA